MQRLYARIETLPQVTLAEIGGAAMGGGLELGLACDLRIAASEAKLGLPEGRLGLIPGGGGTPRVPPVCGAGGAARLLLRCGGGGPPHSRCRGGGWRDRARAWDRPMGRPARGACAARPGDCPPCCCAACCSAGGEQGLHRGGGRGRARRLFRRARSNAPAVDG